MSQVIRIPENLYKRLSFHAKGFETPANVIENMLNFYEEKKGVQSASNFEATCNTPDSLEIIYYPSGVDSFKQELLKNKKAYVLLHKVNGTTELKEWKASSFGVDSDVNRNLRSNYLRGWKHKGIFKAEISTNKNDLD